ncbi:glycosyltransferase [Gemella haemolysans]|uniref:Glycosyltransferase n=1 Tax=Gemella haemolysans TaxID=1379 RepID=A0AAW6B532_9BACL|nr:glycosyltransferase [Gemella haemolysans]MDB6186336.1 glycosyltransferase [Gemella haemolysans]
MVKVFTIKEGVPCNIYGFESSQLARQNIFDEIGVEQKLVLTNLTNFVPNFVETLESLGFKNFYHVIFEKSDIARDKPSVDKSFIENLEDVLEVEYTKDGYVGLVHYKDRTVECYTSQLLYKYVPNEDKFILFNKNGIALEGDVSESYHKYHIKETDKTLSQWQLVSEFLAENSTVDDRFIIDMVNEYPLQLRKFFQNTGRELFAYTHYNILAPFMKFVLQSWCTNVVASPVLEERLGSDKVRFLPPVYVEEVKEEVYTTVKNWCIVGNMTVIKKCEVAIEAFRRTPDSTLTIYGNLPDGYTKDNLPENVKFAGFVKKVPYENHEGYISCSLSECFANSAVEASSKGLVCLLSNVDLGHRYYTSICENTETFSSFDELLKILAEYQQVGEYKSSTFAKEYVKGKVVENYRKVLKL